MQSLGVFVDTIVVCTVWVRCSIGALGSAARFKTALRSSGVGIAIFAA
ncbi:MAG: hypothetical protein ACFNV9_07375 [Corynebacterium matruchotii]